MKFYSRLLLPVAACILLASCKKDLLHWKSTERLAGNTASRLNRIAWLPGGRLIACGGEKFGKGEVLYSDDDGTSWTNYSSAEISNGFYGMGISGDQTVFLTAFNNRLLVSEDAGSSWRTVNIGLDKYLVGVAIPAPQKIMLISTVTQDDGSIIMFDSSFVQSSLIDYKVGFNDIRFADAQTGYVCGYGALLKTTDGGATWQFQNLSSDNFQKMDVHGRDTVYVCGWGGSVFRTCDGGAVWERLRNGNAPGAKSYHLKSIRMLSPATGYCVGEEGVVLYTDDDGNHWSELDHFTGEDIQDIAPMPDGSVVVCGSGGALYRLRY